MISATIDPVSMKDVVDTEHAPYVIEAVCANTLKIHFESEANRQRYLNIPVHGPDGLQALYAVHPVTVDTRKPARSAGNGLSRTEPAGARARDQACPFSTLYWGFPVRHRKRFARHPRTALQWKHLEKMDSSTLKAISRQADRLRECCDDQDL